MRELCWGGVRDGGEVVCLDEKLKVVMLELEEEKKGMGVGLKELSGEGWDGVDGKLKVGDEVKGKVVVMGEYGGLMEMGGGVEGLIEV